jgi:hypothetical protein
MAKKKKFQDKYASMTVIGKSLGISGREVGKKLKEMGLRQDDGAPSQESLDSGIAVFTPLKDGTKHYMWDKWEVKKRLREIDIKKDPEKVESLKIKDVVREMISVMESEDFQMGGGLGYKLADQYLFAELLPKLDEGILKNLSEVRKQVHQSKGTSGTKEHLLDIIMTRFIELFAEKKEPVTVEKAKYLIEKTSDWRVLEDVVASLPCDLVCKEEAFQKMVELKAPEMGLDRARNHLSGLLADVFND